MLANPPPQSPSNKVTLLLLPGLEGSGTLFAPFVSALENKLGAEVHIKVVHYPTSGAHSYAELEAIARAAVPADGAYFVLGESFSGPIAVGLAAGASPRCKGLILCATFVRNPVPLLRLTKPLLSVLPLSAGRLQLAIYFLLGPFCTPALRAMLAPPIAKISSQAVRTRLRAVLDVDVAAKFAKLRLPVLYLRAAHDRTVPKSASELVLQLRPDAQVVQLDAPHFLLQTVPGEAAEVVAGFVRRYAAEQG
jgi:pimeloyl-ACP methyl ester carboxylesterase